MNDEVTTNSAPILVPVDFSVHSEAALIWAADAGRRFNAPIVILHVVHDPGHQPGYYQRALERAGGAEDGGQLREIEVLAQQMMEEFLRAVASRHPELGSPEAFDVRLVVGIPATRILEMADLLGARLIVMGSQGRTGLSHVLLGSKAERVVRLAKIPVTIVKE